MEREKIVSSTTATSVSVRIHVLLFWIVLDHMFDTRVSLRRRPDPRGEQMRSLQTLIARLAAGEEDGVESFWQQQFAFRENVRVRAKDWKTHLEHMFVCKCVYRCYTRTASAPRS